MKACSMFTNCGAADFGLQSAGFQFIAIAELLEVRANVALQNLPYARLVQGNLEMTWPTFCDVVEEFSDEIDLLTACPPCQGLSSARCAAGNSTDPISGSRDARNFLIDTVVKVVSRLKPKIILLENVPQFMTRAIRSDVNGSPLSAFNCFEQGVEGYNIYTLVADLADFGLPQHRKRSFVVAVKSHLVNFLPVDWVPFPNRTHGSRATAPHITIEEIFSKFQLPELDSSSAESADGSQFHPLHVVPSYEENYYRMISSIPSGSGRSAYDNNQCDICKYVNSKASLKCQKCQKSLPKPVTNDKSTGSVRLIKGYHTAYKRLKSNEPANTVLTASGRASSHNTIHPTQNRVLSALECQILQGIPSEFSWSVAGRQVPLGKIREMIGEAVPPMFTEKIGHILAKALRGFSSLGSPPPCPPTTTPKKSGSSPPPSATKTSPTATPSSKSPSFAELS